MLMLKYIRLSAQGWAVEGEGSNSFFAFRSETLHTVNWLA